MSKQETSIGKKKLFIRGKVVEIDACCGDCSCFNHAFSFGKCTNENSDHYGHVLDNCHLGKRDMMRALMMGATYEETV